MMFSSNRYSAAGRYVFAASVCVLVSSGFLPFFHVAPVSAQSFRGSHTVVEVEQALIDAIAKNEKSVVAIARVRNDNNSDAFQLEARPDAFGRRFTPPEKVLPTDPDFIPNEYATGVVIDPSGLILTVYHALGENSNYYVATWDRRVYKATVRAADPRSDMAVLAIDAAGLPAIELGNADTLKKGRIVVALGNPYAIARDGQVSSAWGIVANLARKAPPLNDGYEISSKPTLHHYGTLIQTDAKLNQGTSGGPLLDLDGRMVGLVTSLPPAAGYAQSADYAIPVDRTFRRVLRSLEQGREVEYGFLGIQPIDLTLSERADGLRGMRVNRIQPGPGSPAYKSDLRASDIIIAVDGDPVCDADALVLAIGRRPVESRVELTVSRNGKERRVPVTLGKYPVRGKRIVTNRTPAWRGLRVDYPTVLIESGNRTGPPAAYFEDAVLVTEVASASPAWSAGLRPGMSISHVGSIPVHTPSQFRASVFGAQGPVKLRLTEEENPVREILPES